MQLQIQRGKIARPQRVVIYAPEGLGKTTLASHLPEPLFFDYEKGTHSMDVARFEPQSLLETEKAIDVLLRDPQGFKTLVIDTIDWLEEQAILEVCQTHNKKGIEDFGYGKGFVFLTERINILLSKLDTLAMRAGMHVVLLAHSQVKKFELPDQMGAFDRYELKLGKGVLPLIKEWADAVLFCNWKTKRREEDNTKGIQAKGLGGKERIIYTQHAATHDAKNRHGLSAELVWGDGPDAAAKAAQLLLPIFQSIERVAPPVQAPMPVEADGIPDLPPENGGPGQHPLDKVVGADEAAVNVFLVNRKVIQASQTYRDAPADYASRVLKSPEQFMRQVKGGVA